MAIPPGAWDLAPLIPVVGFMVFGVLRLAASPLGQALADRLRGSSHPPERLAALEDDLARLQQRLEEAEERLDFSERMLARGRSINESEEHPTPV